MATYKLFDTLCGFDDDLLISQTPMICRLLIQSSQSVSHQNQSVKKWLNYLTKSLESEQKQKQKQKPKQKKQQKHNQNQQYVINLNKIWSFLCLLSATYKVINCGYLQWDKHCGLILNLLEDVNVFYHLILRKRCFETLSQIIKYSQFIHNTNSHQLSSQILAKFIKFLQNILFEIVLKKIIIIMIQNC